MRVIITNSYKDLSKHAASIVLNHVAINPKLVLGLATGSTPEGMYSVIRSAHKEYSYDFFHVKTFNLDEYIGLEKDHPQSYSAYMDEQLFDYINVQKQNIHIPDGMASDLDKECKSYERLLSKNIIDVQILGLGSNGHIGFNEPKVPFSSKTHVADLSKDTITANARFFTKKSQVPKQAITMGLSTIMNAKKIILLANGKHKAKAVKLMIEGKYNTSHPASILQKHPDVTVVLDKAAAGMLKHDYSDHKNGWADVRILNQKVLPKYKNILVISPHPDDSAVSCGATVRAMFDHNNVTIAVMTTGHRATIENLNKKSKIQTRRREATNEAQILKAQFIFPQFKFYDHSQKYWQDDLKKMHRLWQSKKPNIILLPHLGDEHPTHSLSTRLVLDYIKNNNISNIELWYYESVWSQHILTQITQVFCYDHSLKKIKDQAISHHKSQVKRLPLKEITETLSRFRALTIPEQKFVIYGQKPISLSEYVEAYDIEKI